MSIVPKPRFEYKYRISQRAYHRILCGVRPYTRPDPHSFENKTGRYFVRSLYYDSPGYDAYIEKMTGVYNRDKFRIRSYVSERSEGLLLKVERKSRIGYLIYKTVDTVPVESFDTFRREGHWGESRGETLDAFSYEVFKSGLRPVTVVDYKREAYFALDGSGVRFSFDHDVRYAWTSELFVDETEFKGCLQNGVIFEIKTEKNDIGWLSDIVRDVGLASEPNSKYANSFEHTSPDVWP